eukprot:12230054-Alexandrium_andersonii.AAC.1
MNAHANANAEANVDANADMDADADAHAHAHTLTRTRTHARAPTHGWWGRSIADGASEQGSAGAGPSAAAAGIWCRQATATTAATIAPT